VASGCLNRPEWQLRAACRGLPTNEWVREPGCEYPEEQRDICRACPVRRECLGFAMADQSIPGLWGGTDERERRRMRRPVAS